VVLQILGRELRRRAATTRKGSLIPVIGKTEAFL
jgi:hypothetical protein